MDVAGNAAARVNALEADGLEAAVDVVKVVELAPGVRVIGRVRTALPHRKIVALCTNATRRRPFTAQIR